ncbi:hypothetical protein OAU16_01685 [Gammaproteobacteria bacterium]|nr:hypothetical protein [Gammaproteobacteria bacterium]
MKFLYVLIGLVLITSCETTPTNIQLNTTSEQRFSICWSKNINGYVGNCNVEMIETDPNHAVFMTTYKSWNDWYALKEANKNISEQYDSGALDFRTANTAFYDSYKLFVEGIQNTWKQTVAEQEATKQRNTQMWKDINEGLQRANDALNQGNPNYRNNNTQNSPQPLKRQQYGTLESEYVSGFNKICVYDGVMGEFTKTISSTSICPLSAYIEID